MNNKTLRYIAILGASLAPVAVRAATSVQCGNVDVAIDVGCSGNGNPIYDYLRAIIIFLGGAIGLAVVITFIVSGIQYASSAGEPANIAKAKQRIFNAVLGLLLYIMMAAVLRYLIPNIFS